MTKSLNERLLEHQKWGFWVGTKALPRKAVRWDPQFHEDGRQKFRGCNWVEVLAHGATHTPETFYGADVEAVGPYERLTYYPAVDEPVCGWQEAEWMETGEYCPRVRERASDGSLEAFCRQHQAVLAATGEESNAREEHSHAE